jgi:hypothetical protein
VTLEANHQAGVRAEHFESQGDHDAAVTNPASEGRNMHEQQCSQLIDSRLRNSKGVKENVSSSRFLVGFSWKGLKRDQIFEIFCFQYFLFRLKALKKTWNFHIFWFSYSIKNLC